MLALALQVTLVFSLTYHDGQFKSLTVHLNDMWIFNLTSAWWSWINGSDTINQVGIYGIRGEASASNRPGTRHGHSMVIHPSGQALFLFGGEGRATSTTLGTSRFYSDLVKSMD